MKHLLTLAPFVADSPLNQASVYCNPPHPALFRSSHPQEGDDLRQLRQ